MKKLLSFVLALALCLGLAVPALAADAPHDVDMAQEPLAHWGSGPSLVVHNVTGRSTIQMASVVEALFDVTVGGGITLDMPFPTANRQYHFDYCGTYLPGSSNRGTWGDFDNRFSVTQADGRSSFEFVCTEDMVGDDKIVAFSIDWVDYDGTTYLDVGHVEFYLRVNPAQPTTPTQPAAPSFTDVPAGQYYAKPVAWAVEQGITTGTTNTTFSPNSPCTTAHILTFLWRSAGRPGATSANMAWSDELAVITSWAKSKGMSVPDNLNTVCTRASAVTYMWQATGSPSPYLVLAFNDVPVTADYAKAVRWALEKGIANGTSAGNFSPNSGCNRGQIVTFLYRQMVEPIDTVLPLLSSDFSKILSTDSGIRLLRTSVDDLKVSTATTTTFSLTQLAVDSSWTSAHGAHTFAWSVDDPSILTLEETVVNGYQAVTFRGQRTGSAKITCRVTGADGYVAEAYCYVTVIPRTTTTTTPPTTPTNPSSDTTAEQMCAKVVELVNQERAKVGLAPLSTLPALTAAANIRAPELVTLFSHTRPDGTTCFTALAEANVTYRAAGENIASGYRTPEAVMDGWMNSPGHKANILSSSYTHIGVAYYNGNWVQMFIGK